MGDTGCTMVAKILKTQNNPWNTWNNYTTSSAKRKTGLLNTVLIIDEELCKAQKEMYRDRALQKRYCKTTEDLAFFEASEDDYRERLEQIKLQKKDNRKKLKAL